MPGVQFAGDDATVSVGGGSAGSDSGAALLALDISIVGISLVVVVFGADFSHALHPISFHTKPAR